MKSVLVLDANQRSALAVTRSLGKKGLTVYTSEEDAHALAGHSRYSKAHFTYPSPRHAASSFTDALASLVEQQQIDLLLPMTELTTSLVLGNRNRFHRAKIPFSDSQTVASISDKCALMKMAESLGVPYPQTWYCEHAASLSCDLDDLTYPVVLKPALSWLEQDGEWRRVAVRTARNAQQVREIFTQDRVFQTHPFMIQAFVEGQGQGVFALYDNGKPVTFFAHRRLREKPPSGGVSVLSESVAVDPILLKHARALLDEAKWHGVAMVEFKVNPDGTPYLMEINTRFWGSLQLAIDAGVDFPWLLAQLASDEHPSPVINYKTGRRLRWLLGDVDNLYLILRDNKYSLQDKTSAILHFLTPAPFKTRHEVNRWGDMRPFFFELKAYIADLRK
jgi:predicted ATP-grasp superfamily ATP-dependent carboligase